MDSEWSKNNCKRGYFQCSQTHNAIQAVLQGRMSVEKASLVFQVPKSTIYRKIQAINHEWEAYNSLVQSTSDMYGEDVSYYVPSGQTYPSSSQAAYGDPRLQPLHRLPMNPKVRAMAKNIVRLNRRPMKPLPSYQKAPLKTLDVKKKSVKPEIVLQDHAYYTLQNNAISWEVPSLSSTIAQPAESSPPPLLYMGEEEVHLLEEIPPEEFVEEVILENEYEEYVPEKMFNHEEYTQEYAYTSQDAPMPRQIRVMDDKGQCIKVLEVEVSTENQSLTIEEWKDGGWKED